MSANTVIIEGSGRHVHLSQEHLEALFGQGFQLEVKKMLSQPEQFASPSKVDIVGPKGTIKGLPNSASSRRLSSPISHSSCSSVLSRRSGWVSV